MRLAVVVASLALAACSSSTDDAAEDPCPVVGTYRLDLTEQTGGACGGGGSGVTYTISEDGDGYHVAIPGFQVGCRIEETSTSCKYQGACNIQVTDAIDPNSNIGTAQFVWTFSKTGFGGANILTIPPAKPFPDGCRSTYDVHASRL
jgi:hypothetical protein